MSKEVSVTLKLGVENGVVSASRNTGSVFSDQETVGAYGAIQPVGFATHEVIDDGSITSKGMVFIRNLDAVNFVDIGIVNVSFYATIKLNPNEFACFPAAISGSLYLKADTAAVNVEILIFEA